MDSRIIRVSVATCALLLTTAGYAGVEPQLLPSTDAILAVAQLSDVPVRTADNVIVASYNIKWLGQSIHKLDKLAEVIQPFMVLPCSDPQARRPFRGLIDRPNASP